MAYKECRFEYMIPKKIHFIWLSGENKSHIVKNCIKSWKIKLPDYKIKCWTLKDFDVDSVSFVREAVSVKKWAFAADYIRLYALFTEGGWYLDSDVFIKKSFNELLDNKFISSVEFCPEFYDKAKSLLDKEGHSIIPDVNIPGIGIQAAIMGSEPKNNFVKACLEWYKNKHFILPDGSFYNKNIAPGIYAQVAEKKFGFKYVNEEQTLTDLHLLPSKFFANGYGQCDSESYAIHLCEGAWRKSSFMKRKIDCIKKDPCIRKLFGKKY